MKKQLSLKKDVNMKRIALVFSEVLVLFLISGLSMSTAYAAPSEENNLTDVLKSASNQIWASLKPALSPVNPDFDRQNIRQLLIQTSSSGGHGIGLASSHVDLIHLSAISSIGFAPSPVSYDLKALNKVTSVKNQGWKGLAERLQFNDL